MAEIWSRGCMLSVDHVVDRYTVEESHRPLHCWICEGRFKPPDEVVVVYTLFGNLALHEDCWRAAEVS